MTFPRLRLAIQRSGRLADATRDLLYRCGLPLAPSRDRLFARVKDFPLDVLLVRDDDIPRFVADGVCDVGIVGRNVFDEGLSDHESLGSSLGATESGHQSRQVEGLCPARIGILRDEGGNIQIGEVLALGFGRCRLSLAVPQHSEIATLEDLEGRRIATTHRYLLRRWLDAQSIEAHVVRMHGSVEISPSLGLADAICDLVATGATLEANHLKPLGDVLNSEAILVTRMVPHGQHANMTMIPDIRADIHRDFERLLQRIKAVTQARGCWYVMLHAPRSEVDAISELLPGAEAPTILPLEGSEGNVAVHVVCHEKVFWGTLEALRAMGASQILVMPVHKMLP